MYTNIKSQRCTPQTPCNLVGRLYLSKAEMRTNAQTPEGSLDGLLNTKEGNIQNGGSDPNSQGSVLSHRVLSGGLRGRPPPTPCSLVAGWPAGSARPPLGHRASRPRPGGPRTPSGRVSGRHRRSSRRGGSARNPRPRPARAHASRPAGPASSSCGERTMARGPRTQARGQGTGGQTPEGQGLKGAEGHRKPGRTHLKLVA